MHPGRQNGVTRLLGFKQPIPANALVPFSPYPQGESWANKTGVPQPLGGD